MTDSKSLSNVLKSYSKLFWSWFSQGPGTFGTLATLPFLYALSLANPPIVLFIPILVIATVVSCFMANIVQKQLELHDPQWIVVDEVLGMATQLFIQSSTILT